MVPEGERRHFQNPSRNNNNISQKSEEGFDLVILIEYF